MVGENGPPLEGWQLPERLTIPADEQARAEVLADARRIYGLDLSDDDRAAWIRDRYDGHIVRGDN